jgi:hypothetical protein
MADPQTLLVFGDLHGRVLPAFRLAARWARAFGRPVAGVLQVGDLGYFPDVTRMDRATLRHAADDPLEYGAADVAVPNPSADAAFADPHAPPVLWFTAGNHEDFELLEGLAGGGRGPDFAADAYGRVRGIKDGRVAEPVPGLRVGAVWGVDGAGRNARGNLPPRGYIRDRAADELLAAGPFDVLLAHDSPADARRAGYGSETLAHLIALARPAFAFFGHYKGAGGRVEGAFGRTAVYHMAGFELRHGRDGAAEPGSVGVLTWDGGGAFEYVPADWLRRFTRHNWKHD